MRVKPADSEAMQTIARALADPHRYQIVKLLAQAGSCLPCSTFRDHIPVTPPTFSHHMRELRDAGLITEQRTGRTMSYALRRDVLAAFLEGIERDFLLPVR